MSGASICRSAGQAFHSERRAALRSSALGRLPPLCTETVHVRFDAVVELLKREQESGSAGTQDEKLGFYTWSARGDKATAFGSAGGGCLAWCWC